MNAKLTVRESQQAVFLNEGVIADVYQPGMYTLTTQNMPILATLKGWPALLSVIDMAWGALLTAVSAGAAKAALNWARA